MEKAALISYFDANASEWDTLHSYEPDKLRCLASLCVEQGARVLEVGCGTGAMLPYILEKEPDYVLCVDFSKEMIALAEEKQKNPVVEFYCGDIIDMQTTATFDCAIIHETFSYIENRGSLIRQMHHLLAPNGRVMVCYTQSRQNVNATQPQGVPVSLPLPAAKTLAANYAQYFDMDTLVDSDAIYAVSGKKLLLL